MVSFLWSFRNPANELAVARRDRAAPSRRSRGPGLRARARHPRVRAHAVRAAQRVRRAARSTGWARSPSSCGPTGLACPIVLMHSSGRRDDRRRRPAGADRPRAVRARGGRARPRRGWPARMGEPDVVTCDLGGTSLDVALIVGRRGAAAHPRRDPRALDRDVDGRRRLGRLGRRVDRVGRPGRRDPRRAALGRRRSRARVLRPRRDRADGDRRARRARLPRPRPASSTAACRSTPTAPAPPARRSATQVGLDADRGGLGHP